MIFQNWEAVGALLITIFVVIALAVISLIIGIKAVKGEKTGFGEVLITGLHNIFLVFVVTTVFMMVLPLYAFIGSIAALIISMFIIKARHETTFLGAFGAIIIYTIMLIILYVVMKFVFGNVFILINDLTGFDLSSLFPF